MTLEYSRVLFNQVAPQYNLPPINEADIEGVRNTSAKELILKYRISPWKLWKLTQYIQGKLKQNIHQIKMVDGLAEVVTELKENGHQVGIVTSNTRENVRLFLESHQFPELDFIHSEKNLFGKAKVLRSLLRELGLPTSEAVYVGDEVRDVEAAKKAGICIVAVAWGFNSPTRLALAQPDYLVSRPTQLLSIVGNLYP